MNVEMYSTVIRERSSNQAIQLNGAMTDDIETVCEVPQSARTTSI